MKRILALILSIVSVMTACFCMTGCKKDEKLAMGKEMVKYASQLDAIRALDRGDVHAIVIDSIMAGYYSNVGDYAGKISVVPDLILAQESYGIAAKKGNYSLVREINDALINLTKNGTTATIANEFGVADSLAIDSSIETNPISEEQASDNGFQTILNSNSKKIVIGITIFAPIAYYKSNSNIGEQSNYTGFDIELARAAVAYLSEKYQTNLNIEFSVISWKAKEALLENGTIHLVWNGMTITPEREENMCISLPYLYNKQVAVVKTEKVNDYSDKASFKNAAIGVESGSAGQSVVKGK